MPPAYSHLQTRGYINYLPAWPLAAYCETVYPPSSALSSLGNQICLLQWKQGVMYQLSSLLGSWAPEPKSAASVETNPRKVKMDAKKPRNSGHCRKWCALHGSQMSEDLGFRVTSNCLIRELLKIFLMHMNQVRKLMPWNLFPGEKAGLSWEQPLSLRKDLGNLLTLQKKICKSPLLHHFQKCFFLINLFKNTLFIYLFLECLLWDGSFSQCLGTIGE